MFRELCQHDDLATRPGAEAGRVILAALEAIASGDELAAWEAEAAAARAERLASSPFTTPRHDLA